MTLRKQQKSFFELEKRAKLWWNHTSNAGNVSPFQASVYFFKLYIRYSTSLIFLYFDTWANQLMSAFRPKYFSAYVHIDIVVKYS
jgi:hypothetical protein